MATRAAQPEQLARSLLAWYSRSARDLPWRRRTDPYRVWVSEVMLQQTTVETAAPYFRRFVRRFPTLRSLAAAPEADLLALWSGLGYYHRARNMLKAARLMVERHRGRVPASLPELRGLPGVGAYTAGAVLSIGFNLPFAALDGNAVRVLSRVGALRADPARAAGRRAIEDLWARALPEGDASRFNQALMDLGATICLPSRPRCTACPLAAGCAARRLRLAGLIPPPKKRPSPIRVDLVSLLVRRPGRVLLVQRPAAGLMGGMWDFPMAPGGRDGRVRAIRLAARFGASLIGSAGTLSHAITRHRIRVQVYGALPAPGRPAPDMAERTGRADGAALRIAGEADPARGRWIREGELAGAAGGPALTGIARKILGLAAGRPGAA